MNLVRNEHKLLSYRNGFIFIVQPDLLRRPLFVFVRGRLEEFEQHGLINRSKGVRVSRVGGSMTSDHPHASVTDRRNTRAWLKPATIGEK